MIRPAASGYRIAAIDPAARAQRRPGPSQSSEVHAGSKAGSASEGERNGGKGKDRHDRGWHC